MYGSSSRCLGRLRWRMVFLLLVFSGMAGFGSSAPTGKVTTLPSSTPAPLSLASSKGSSNQEVGSPSELAWQAWLLVDTQTGAQSGLDSASLLRRITPKSVFVAPEFNVACAEGYHSDNLGRCVKTVHVNEDNQLDFLLQRLNQFYNRKTNPPQAIISGDKKIADSSGPFQFNIPILPEIANIQKDQEITELPVNVPVVAVEEALPVQHLQQDTFVKKEELQKNKDTTSHKRSNSSSVEEGSSTEYVVPVVDFVEDANKTFSDVVDYKIVGNRTHAVGHNGNDAKTEGETDEEFETTTTVSSTPRIPIEDTAPTLVLVLTPTKVPAANGQLDTSLNGSLGHVILHMKNSTGNWTSKEMIGSIIPLPDNIRISTEVQLPRNETDKKVVSITHEIEDLYSDDESLVPEGELVDQEDYSTDDSVTESTDDDFAETTEDELLRPGEAGITIPIIKTQENRPKEPVPEEAKDIEIMETTSPPENFNLTVVNDESEATTTMEPVEEPESIVSSEVSINGDFVLETTIVDVNTDKMKNSTEMDEKEIASVKRDNAETLDDILQMDKEFLPEPEVVFSSQEHHSMSSDRKRTGQVKVDGKPNGPTRASAPTSNDKPQKPGFVLFNEAIDEQASYNTERIVPPDVNRFDSSKINQFQSPASSHRHNQGFVKFPSNEERPSSSYVRFPSDEVNSIHGSGYKPRLPYQDDFVSTTSTKSSVPIHQKPSHWRIPQGFRVDRPPTTSNSQRQKQRPLLLRFWSKMPLLRDPSFYPSSREDPAGDEVSRYSPQNVPPLRVNFNDEGTSREPIGG